MTDELTWTPDVARLDSLELWGRNPKRMSKTRAERLLKSWRDMGQYQTLAIGPGGECYDGTQRVNTLKAAGYKGSYEVRVLRSNRPLTDTERERVIIESTVGTVGALDFDALAGWDNAALQTFGLDAEALAEWNDAAANLREMINADSEPVDYDELWKGMPEFEQEDKTSYQAIHVHFKNAEEVRQFGELIGQSLTEKTRSIWFSQAEKMLDKNERYTA